MLKIKAQKDRMLKDWKSVFKILKNFNITVSPKIFNWAWCAVNTRCVTLSPTQPPNTSQLDFSNPTIALIPLFDMLNHSPTAKIEAYLDKPSNSFLFKCNTDVCEGDQVFLSYGPHDNNFLLVEYGFVVPNNPYNFVELDEEFENLGVTEYTTNILKEYGFYGEYTVSIDSISPRLITAIRLHVLSHSPDKKHLLSTWKRVINGELTSMPEDIEKTVVVVIEVLLKRAAEKFQKRVDELEERRKVEEKSAVEVAVVVCKDSLRILKSLQESFMDLI
ncbi:SET domain-containing protein 4 [Nowakowskiella sp. JEL0407]|nr:SET domain-containing protein 4 [Nowakowskiella sp. JEL0407]